MGLRPLLAKREYGDAHRSTMVVYVGCKVDQAEPVMKIVAGALSTPEGKLAIEHAVSEARAHPDSELHLVTFVEALKSDEGLKSYQDELRQRDAWVQETASDLAEKTGLPVRGHTPQGTLRPADAILNVARAVEADLIVIAIRRRSRVGKLLLGSNAQDILLGADCPVLGVKLEEEAA